MKIKDTDTAIRGLLEKLKVDLAKFHPDTENTFAAYQIEMAGYEFWVNARNGDIITIQRKINRY